jgi:hypothetical protein
MTQTDDPVDEAVGSVAEEAAKLLGALSGWARENGDGLHDGLAHGLSSLDEGLHEHVATGSPDCAWCPVCRTVSAVRQASPEVRTHLTSAASSLMLAVSGLLVTRPPARDGDRARVERIPLDDQLDDSDERSDLPVDEADQADQAEDTSVRTEDAE